jgi:hypothetical protein
LARHFAGLFFIMSFGPSFYRPFLCHVFWPVVLPAFSLSCLLARRFAGLFLIRKSEKTPCHASSLGNGLNKFQFEIAQCKMN